ncbi:MAG: CoA pyrophosphatase [Alphaproteobacteria bacterium]
MTPALVRRRLAARDTGRVAQAMPAGRIAAAVLIALVARERAMTAVFTRRTDHLADHPGQVSFPGGRVEPGDANPVATALREAGEEIGLAAARVEVVGCLDLCDTSTGFAVTPVVGLVAPPLDLTLDTFEVAEVFEVPLDFLLDPANRRREQRRYRGRLRDYYVLDYDGRTIWGATARMVVDLSAALGRP